MVTRSVPPRRTDPPTGFATTPAAAPVASFVGSVESGFPPPPVGGSGVESTAAGDPSGGADDGAMESVTAFVIDLPRLKRRRARREPRPPSIGLPYFLAGPENRTAAFIATDQTHLLRAAGVGLLIGPTGCGKTALALHLAARLAMSDPRRDQDAEPVPVLYKLAMDYAREFAEAVEVGDVDTLRRKLVDAPVLIIDDLPDIASRVAASGELSRRIADRLERGRPTIITSRRYPGSVKGLNESLVSRVVSGLSLTLAPPRGEARRRLIAEWAIHVDRPLDPVAVNALDAGLPDDASPRDIEASVRALDLYCRRHGIAADPDAVQYAMDASHDNRSITIEQITAAVARRYRLRQSQLKSASRSRTTVRARSLAMHLARQHTGMSTHQIGAFFGGRDHTTVMHALKKIDSQLPDDGDLRSVREEIEEKLRGG